jgi:hypothetical protein
MSTFLDSLKKHFNALYTEFERHADTTPEHDESLIQELRDWLEKASALMVRNY